MESVLNDWYSRFDQALKDAGIENASFANFNIEEFLDDTAIVFIVIGAFFFLVGIVGCIGACCQVKSLLILVCRISYFASISTSSIVVRAFALCLRGPGSRAPILTLGFS